MAERDLRALDAQAGPPANVNLEDSSMRRSDDEDQAPPPPARGAFGEHIEGAKVRITWPCGHYRIQTLTNGPRGQKRPVTEEAAKFMAQYWRRENGGVDAGPCPTCCGADPRRARRRSHLSAAALPAAGEHARGAKVSIQTLTAGPRGRMPQTRPEEQ